MYQNIPNEMKQYKQWLVWKLEHIDDNVKPTKVPYCVSTGRLASVSDPNTWCSFDDAIQAVSIKSNGYSGIGFVFSTNDPFSGIDLDTTEGDVAKGIITPEEANIAYQRQFKIYTAFDSYSELSPSGKGIHIIVKGEIPSGRKRSHIEVYSSKRFFTMTGNIYKDAPIMERQELLTILYNELGAGVNINQYDGDAPQREDDITIINKATNAANGDKFKLLMSGNWEGAYNSHSEADLAFFNIVAFYTQNREQLTRMFRASPLGRRDKAWRDQYVNYNIQKSFDMMLPPLDMEGLQNAINASFAKPIPAYEVGEALSGSSNEVPMHKTSPASEPQPTSRTNNAKEPIAPLIEPSKCDITFPPGLVGEIADFIYAAAPRPVKRIALVGAIGLMAGIVGKAYNVSNTGLNQYVMLIAATGRGKEAMASGIDRLMIAVRNSGVPSAQEFLGPGEIASAQSLIKYMSKTSSCFVSVSGEIGMLLSQMSSERAPAHMIGLKRLLLDLFNKSGQGQSLKPMIYADMEKNTQEIASPSFTWVGESTPERFYSSLDEGMIADGFMPRWNIIEYDGPRPELNEAHGAITPSFNLIERMGTLIANCQAIMAKRQAVNVAATPEAAQLLTAFNKRCDYEINSSSKNLVAELWNRAHIKVLKMSALIAVGNNPFEPCITPDVAQWAIDLIVEDIINILSKFEVGMIGKSNEETKQLDEITRIFREYTNNDLGHAIKYGSNFNMHSKHVIPYCYVQKRLIAVACFRTDRLGSTSAIKRTIQTLIDNDYIRELGNNQKTDFGTAGRCFIISKPSAFVVTA